MPSDHSDSESSTGSSGHNNMFNPNNNNINNINNRYVFRCPACYRSFPSRYALQEHRQHIEVSSLASALLNLVNSPPSPPQQPNQPNVLPPAPPPRRCNNAALSLSNVLADPSALAIGQPSAACAAAGMYNCRNHHHYQPQPQPQPQPKENAYRYHPYERPPSPIAETTNWRRTRNLLCLFVETRPPTVRVSNLEQQASSPERTVTDPIVREGQESGDEANSGTKNEELDLDLKL